MRRDILESDDPSVVRRRPVAVTLHDVEAVRLLLTGESVVDWQRLAFRTLADVDQCLSTHLLDVNVPDDAERLRYVFNEAVSYLEEQLHLHFPAELRNPSDVRQVFLWASQRGGFRRTQILSCVVLKLMHIIHHMEAADLRFRLTRSEERLFALAQRRVLGLVHDLQDQGVPITAFYGSRKPRSSVITKLLAKREAVAATVFDKLRFRVVVEHHADLFPTIAAMARSVFPFNYVVPGQSHNNLLDATSLVELLPEDDLPFVHTYESERLEEPRNEFSGASYRSVNWIVDTPVRVSESAPERFSFELGQVAYVKAEFQLLDEATAHQNEQGENAHNLYKARQQRRVAARLKRGGAARGE